MFYRLTWWVLPLLCLSGSQVLGAEQSRGANLPLKRVVLFSSGVGFFERSGQVQDNANVEMKFKIDDINDLLKSMVVQDLDGGQASTVTYGSKDPITKTLGSFTIDLTANPSLAQLLGQIRGERVDLEAPNKLSGIILGVEVHKKKLGDRETIDVDVLNLLTDEGLRAVPLDSVSRIKLSNEQLDAELRKALAVLASAHATDKKSVTLSFLGKGTRRVRVGYVQETPVWKTTYRLVLSDGKPLLQGWAIVENTSEEDWSGVNLTLVSGRPISFTMDLYEPLYIPRPQVQLELYSSLRPQTHGENLFARPYAAPPPRAAKAAVMMGGMGGGMGGAVDFAAARSAPASPKVNAPRQALAEEIAKDFRTAGEPTWNPGQGVQAAAQGGNVGNLFQYAIATPVSVPRQQSAMLPIVNADVKGEKLSIYNAGVQAKHPLYGLRFTNLTGLHLMQGPITVFDGGVYAGDAKIEDVAPGSQRLISYGLDLDVEVAPESKGRPEELLSVRLLKGTLIATHKFVRTTEYTVKNSGKQAKTVLVECPIEPMWTLVSPAKPAEKTRNLYRFRVEAKPGTPVKLQVDEQRTDRQHVALTNIDDDTIQFYMSAKVISEQVKTALAEVVKQKRALEEVATQLGQRQQQIRGIDEDQARIRQNMAQLDRNTDVYKNYVKKFSEQEAQIEKLRGQMAKLNEETMRLRKALDEYLIGLDLQ